MAGNGRQVLPEVKSKILSELLTDGCVVSDIARSYGISRGTLYEWRKDQQKLMEGTDQTTDSRAKFVELSVKDSTSPTGSTLEKALLVFSDFSLSIEGKVKTSNLSAILKLLEESC